MAENTSGTNQQTAEREREDYAVPIERLNSKETLFMLLALHMEASPFCEKPIGTEINKTGIVVCESDSLQRILAMDCSRKQLHAAQLVTLNLTTSINGCNVYLSRKPCTECAKCLVQGGVQSIFFWPKEGNEENSREVNQILRSSSTLLVPLVPAIDDNIAKTTLCQRTRRWKCEQCQISTDNLEELRKEKWMNCGSPSHDDNKKLIDRTLCSYDELLNCHHGTCTDTGNFTLEFITHLLQLCFLLAARSDDPRNGVGAIIYNQQHQYIVGAGYNGYIKHATYGNFPRCGRGNKRTRAKGKYMVHAEVNALLFRSVTDTNSAVLISSKMPCSECKKAIIASGIKTVITVWEAKKEEEGPKEPRGGNKQLSAGASGDKGRGQEEDVKDSGKGPKESEEEGARSETVSQELAEPPKEADLKIIEWKCPSDLQVAEQSREQPDPQAESPVAEQSSEQPDPQAESPVAEQSSEQPDPQAESSVAEQSSEQPDPQVESPGGLVRLPKKDDLMMYLALHMERSPLCEEPKEKDNIKFCKTGIAILNIKGSNHILAIDCSRNRLHAVQKALLSSPRCLQGCTIYLSRYPCIICAKLLIQGGVHHVCYWPNLEQLEEEKPEVKADITSVSQLFLEARVICDMYIPLVDLDTVQKKISPKTKVIPTTDPIGCKSIFNLPEKVMTSILGALDLLHIKEKDYKATFINQVQNAYDCYRALINSPDGSFENAEAGQPSEPEEIEKRKYIHAQQLCFLLAARTDNPGQAIGVGALICQDDCFVGMGYNGFPKGNLHSHYLQSPQRSGKTENLLICAEANALYFRYKQDLKEATLYTSNYPCPECMDLITAVGGITKIVCVKPKGKTLDPRPKGTTCWMWKQNINLSGTSSARALDFNSPQEPEQDPDNEG